MPELTPELLILLPLAVAAGIDLYLTLLILGAVPTTPWWDHPLPGAFGDMDTPWVVIVVGILYLLEFVAERFATGGLVWNAVQGLIRPVSAALLATLLLSGHEVPVVLAGALAAGLIALVTHAGRSGSLVLRWLDPGPGPHRLLVSIFEDVVVLGLTVAALDAPLVALGAAGVVILAGLPGLPSRVRAFVFAVRLAAGRAFQAFRQRAWTGGEQLPSWVRSSLADDIMAPGGGLRGARAGILRMRGLPRFATGWVVVRGDDPAFVHGRRGAYGQVVELGVLSPSEVAEDAWFRRIDLQDEAGRPVRIFFFVSGPGPESLAAEFRVSRRPDPAAATVR